MCGLDPVYPSKSFAAATICMNYAMPSVTNVFKDAMKIKNLFLPFFLDLHYFTVSELVVSPFPQCLFLSIHLIASITHTRFF